MIWVEENKKDEVPLARVRLLVSPEDYREGERINLMSISRDDTIRKDRKTYVVTRREFEQTEDGEWYATILGRETG